MYKDIIASLIHFTWPEVIEVNYVNMTVNNLSGIKPAITIEPQSVITDTGNGHGSIALQLTSGTADIQYAAVLRWRSPPQILGNFTWDIDFLRRSKVMCKNLEAAVQDHFGDNSIRIRAFEARGGLGQNFRAKVIKHHGPTHSREYATLDGLDSSSQFNMRAHVESLTPLSANNITGPMFQPICQGCGSCPGCRRCNINPNTIVKGVSLNPSYISPSSGNLAAVLGPTGAVGGPGNYSGGLISNSGTVNMGSSKKVPNAYDVLKFLERELDVKTGMLSGQNLLLHRVTIYDRDDWEERLKKELPELKAKMGDKVGLLGDMRIVGLDEPYIVDPDCQVVPPKGDTATGKVGVHMIYRATYQAMKLTIMALVKA